MPNLYRIALALALPVALAAQLNLHGRVTDENGTPLARAAISIQRLSDPPRTALSGPTGAFEVSLPAFGTYLVSVQRTGFLVLSGRPIEFTNSATEFTFVLNPNREFFQSVEVGESASPVDPTQTGREQRLSGTEVNDVPFASTGSFRNSLRLMPGVMQDNAAGLHFHGGAENQTQYTLNGFDVSDPITGRFATTLAVEGIRSVDLAAARESPQFGHGSAGVLTVRTENGTDKYHFTATNFVPGVDTRGGISVGDWSPRAAFSGPLLKGRAWFSDSLTGGYNSGYVSGLPSGQDRNASWSAGNLYHSQVNLTASNFLSGDFLVHYSRQSHFGLGVLDPVGTTSARRSDEWLGAVKDSQAWRSGAYLEVGLSWQRVFHLTTPQGSSPYIISPTGRSGNYFLESRESGGRKQLFLNFFPPAIRRGGRHQLQSGVDLQRLDYSAFNRRTSYRVVGPDGLTTSETSFSGPGVFHLFNQAVAGYVNDHWTPVRKVAIDIGIRYDWDRLTGDNAFSPRAAVSWAPFDNARTKFVAGYGILHDATNLVTFGRPLDQQAITLPLLPNGLTGPAVQTVFVSSRNLRLPRYQQWSGGVEHDFGHGISVTGDWMRKRGSNGFVYLSGSNPGSLVEEQPFPGAQTGGSFVLASARRDAYDEYSVTIRQSLPKGYQWLASYVRSRAVSNAVLDTSIDQPLQVLDNFGRLPWDAPNRFVSEGFLPAHFKNLSLGYLVDWRSGFPYSLLNSASQVVGPVGSQRYPANFDLNLHGERSFTLFGYKLALRLGVNNVTGHRNPTAVNNVVGAPGFGRFLGNEGRHAVVRIRVFGRAK